MTMLSRLAALVAAFAFVAPAAAATTSVYQSQPDDPAAVTVAGVGDGKADDSGAIQGAIDKATKPFAGGLVFLPSGRYRITRTIIMPPALRIVGVGKSRPVILLADNTPGFQMGLSEMVVFSGGDQYAVGKVPVPLPNIVPRDKPIRDANSGTFYTAMSNVDFEMGKGNPAAIGVRMHVAQHGFLRHMEFRTSSGFAGVYMVGNEAEDLHFVGGRYGIVTEKTSPAWQFTLIDTLFEGQRDAAIREHEPQLTLLNVTFRNVPIGIEIDEGYGDWLYGKDVRFENVSKAGVIISNEDNAYTQVSFDNALLIGTPVFARFRESGRTLGQAGAYRVNAFTYGLTLPEVGAMGTYETRYRAEPLAKLPPPRARAIPALPGTDQWVNVRMLGVRGDAKTDDTAALQAAIDAHPVLYLPTGFYLISDTLRLRPDTVLIGLHPGLTNITLPDNAPAFAGIGSFKAMIEAPKGGRNMLTSLGIFTGRVNPRAGNILWKAGEDSLLDDIKVQGGGGTQIYDGKGLDALARPGGDPVMNMHYDEMRPSILVTEGGGGTFSTIWSPNTFASAGFYVSDTSTPGHVYQLSNEHHIRNEIVLDNVRNWEFLAPQTEQEVGEQGDAISLEIRNSSNLLFANYHGYRVTRNFKPNASAVKLYNSSDIRFRNVHVNAESGFAYCDDEGCGTYLRASKFPFENAITDMTRNIEVREREFAVLDIPAEIGPAGGARAAQASALPAGVFPAGAQLRKLADGFWSISGAATDDAGKLYFVEHRFNRIYSWTGEAGLNIVQDAPIDPVNLAVDRSGNLLVLSMLGPKASVYSVAPKPGSGEIALLSPKAGPAPQGAKLLFPVNLWVNGEFRDQYDPATDHFTTLAELFKADMAAPQPGHYASPDGSLALPAFRIIQQGPPTHQGWRFSHALDSHGFVAASAAERIFVTNESEDKTYSGIVGADGTLTGLKAFANRGGESVAVDAQGRVFVANGQVFVYAPDGAALGRIDVPERPLQLIFGGPGKRTLFILTHHALYSVGL